MGHATDLVDRLDGLSDLMIWVLDPQKYADRAVHRRFLVPLAGHSEVVAVVLNQADVLTAAQVEDCVHDLRRLLDSENLHDVQVLVTSAVTGAGIEELRKLLIDAVSARRASAARIAADVDKILVKFRPYGEVTDPDAGLIPHDAASGLAADFAAAAGVEAIGDTLRSARELRALDYTGWPVSWMVERLAHRDPIRKVRLGKIWDELRGVTAGPTGAQQAEIDNSLTQLADKVSRGLPRPWSRTVRAAVRSEAEQIPSALGRQIGAALPEQSSGERWWRLAAVAQGLLLGCAVIGVAWFVALIVIGMSSAGRDLPSLFTNLLLLPVALLVVAASLEGGWLLARQSALNVDTAARRETEQLVEEITRRLTDVADSLVIAPAEQELAELDRYRDELEVAAGHGRV
jgi:hypothetical protein